MTLSNQNNLKKSPIKNLITRDGINPIFLEVLSSSSSFVLREGDIFDISLKRVFLHPTVEFDNIIANFRYTQ
jgi:hypothetical protein